MKPSLLILILLGIFPVLSHSQAWNMQWEKQSDNQKLDYFADVCEMQDGSFAVIGCSGRGSSADLCLLHYSTAGELMWSKTFENPDNDLPKKISCMPNGDLLILGETGPADSRKVILIRTNNEGKEKWRKTPDAGAWIKGDDITALDDNGFILAGGKGTDSENTRLWIAKMSETGDLIWEKTYNDETRGCLSTVKKLPNGDMVLGGQLAANGKNDCDMVVLRTDGEGRARWNNQIKSPKSKEWTECVCCSPDSCFFLVGWLGNCLNDINSDDPVFDYDLVLKKIDCSGKVLWSKNFDAEGSEGGNAITIRPDGNFLVAGAKLTSFEGKIGPWILEVDKNGNLKNEMLLNMKLYQASKVINCSDGGFVVIGPGMNENLNNYSDGWIAKFSEL